MIFEKLNENIYLFIDESFYDTIAGAIVLPNKLIMIDSGMHVPKMQQFREWVEKDTGKKFEYLVLTHYHGDHLIGNQIFSDCKIIADEFIHEYMKGMKERWTLEEIEKAKERSTDPTSLDGLVITLPNVKLNDYMEITDDNVKVIIKKTGGHTEDSTYVYCPNYKVLFAGDNLFAGQYPYGGADTCNPDIWMKTYKEFLSLDVEWFIPGHSRDWSNKAVKETLDFMKDMKEQVLELHDKGKTEEEILNKIDKIKFYYYDKDNQHDLNLKASTLKRWYDVWIKK